MKRSFNTEYRGFVRNAVTGRYDGLFTTQISSLLARDRAVKKAKESMKLQKNIYNIDDVVVKKRKVFATYSNWEAAE